MHPVATSSSLFPAPFFLGRRHRPKVIHPETETESRSRVALIPKSLLIHRIKGNWSVEKHDYLNIIRMFDYLGIVMYSWWLSNLIYKNWKGLDTEIWSYNFVAVEEVVLENILGALLYWYKVWRS